MRCNMCSCTPVSCPANTPGFPNVTVAEGAAFVSTHHTTTKQVLATPSNPTLSKDLSTKFLAELKAALPASCVKALKTPSCRLIPESWTSNWSLVSQASRSGRVCQGPVSCRRARSRRASARSQVSSCPGPQASTAAWCNRFSSPCSMLSPGRLSGLSPSTSQHMAYANPAGAQHRTSPGSVQSQHPIVAHANMAGGLVDPI